VRGTDAYYYDSDGYKVLLEGANELAVDLTAAESAELSAPELTKLKVNGRELRGGVVMLDADDVPGDIVAALDAVGALQPVFGAKSSGLIVVLPEVRIETGNEDEARKVRRFLESSDIDAEVVRDAGEFMVVRPRSGRGVDALQLANRVEEAVHPLMAQAHFLRVVPRP
jgi:hypothetical protein